MLLFDGKTTSEQNWQNRSRKAKLNYITIIGSPHGCEIFIEIKKNIYIFLIKLKSLVIIVNRKKLFECL